MTKRTAKPRHVGIIPDGNRRWAVAAGLTKADGYAYGVEPGCRLFQACRERGIEELSVYGYTKDNVKRPADQVKAFRRACRAVSQALTGAGARVRLVGDGQRAHAAAEAPGPGPKINLLVDYGWRWDVEGLARDGRHRTDDIPPIDLIIRWGGARRLSGFLPLQSVYADFYVVDALWPDYQDRHLDDALAWYARQDRTLGG